MAQLSDDCFAHGKRLLGIDQALELVQSRLSPLAGTEEVSLHAATGRILAGAVEATRDVPPHDNSAVDGYAVYFDDLRPEGETRLPVTGRAAAGHPLGRSARRGEAVRIFTGAPMPTGHDGGPDTVFMQEDCRHQDDVVVLPTGIHRGANRRQRGEDVKAGATILAAGRRLLPQDVGLAASVGKTKLHVFQRLRVALCSTGDEVAGILCHLGVDSNVNTRCLKGSSAKSDTNNPRAIETSIGTPLIDPDTSTNDTRAPLFAPVAAICS